MREHTTHHDNCDCVSAMTTNAPIDFEKEFNAIIPCTCIDAYKLRHLIAPDCPNCNFIADLIDLGLSIAKRVEAQTIERCQDYHDSLDQEMQRNFDGIKRLYGPKSDKESPNGGEGKL